VEECYWDVSIILRFLEHAKGKVAVNKPLAATESKQTQLVDKVKIGSKSRSKC